MRFTEREFDTGSSASWRPGRRRGAVPGASLQGPVGRGVVKFTLTCRDELGEKVGHGPAHRERCAEGLCGTQDEAQIL